MSDKPKHKFWQLHLSTSVLLMLVAGGILWIETTVFVAAGAASAGISMQWTVDYVLGLPFPYYQRTDFIVNVPQRAPDPIIAMESLNKTFLQVLKREKRNDNYGFSPIAAGDCVWQQFFLFGFVIDILVIVLMLFCVAFVSESLIRRREARKT